MDESLCALKECKRAVEIRYKNMLTEMSEQSNKLNTLSQQSIHLQASNKHLQDKIYSLEREKHEQTEIMAELQQNLVFKSSEYENQIRTMQVELGNRLDEIDGVKKDDVNKVKSHYMDLFQEKASEVMILREEAERLNGIVDEYKSKVKDLEFREEELNNIVNKMREGKCLSEETVDFQNKLKDSLQYSHHLQEKVEKISKQFETLREDKQNQFERFDFHILELQKIIRDKDVELNTLKQNLNDSVKYNTQDKDMDILSHNNNTQTSQETLAKPRNKKKKKKSKTPQT